VQRPGAEIAAWAALGLIFAWVSRYPTSLYVSASPTDLESGGWLRLIEEPLSSGQGLVLQLVGGGLALLTAPAVALSLALVFLVALQAVVCAQGERPQKLAMIVLLTLSPFALGLSVGGRYGLLIALGGVLLAVQARRMPWVALGLLLACLGRVEAGIAAGILVACGGGRRLALGLAGAAAALLLLPSASPGVELGPASLVAVAELAPRGGWVPPDAGAWREGAPWTGTGLVLLVAGAWGWWKARRGDLALGAGICAVLALGSTLGGPFGGPWLLFDRALPEVEPAAFAAGTFAALGVGLLAHRGRGTWVLGPLLLLEGFALTGWPQSAAGVTEAPPAPVAVSLGWSERLSRVGDVASAMVIHPGTYMDMAPPVGERPNEDEKPANALEPGVAP